MVQSGKPPALEDDERAPAASKGEALPTTEENAAQPPTPAPAVPAAEDTAAQRPTPSPAAPAHNFGGGSVLLRPAHDKLVKCGKAEAGQCMRRSDCSDLGEFWLRVCFWMLLVCFLVSLAVCVVRVAVVLFAFSDVCVDALCFRRKHR